MEKLDLESSPGERIDEDNDVCEHGVVESTSVANHQARIAIDDAATYPEIYGGKYLIISNIAKKPNVIQLINTAHAFYFEPILIGAPKIRDNIAPYLRLPPEVPVRWFPSLELAREFLLGRNVTVVGIEILESAHSCLDYSFPQRIAIMPGNEGDGMNQKQMKNCDKFVYIPQYGNGTASLNVHVATSLVMYHYTRFNAT
jgi:tRNA G18 (ribose-2'-O)-methylase SpoU